jgi:cysteine-rich repeat protein
MRGHFIALLIALTGGCVKSEVAECGDRVCPKDTVCIELAQDDMHVVTGDPHRCVATTAVPACEGSVDLADCAAGACYATTDGLVCLPKGCGNGLRDMFEVCDDGNADIGDGCSAACLSDETCGNGILDGLDLDDTGAYTPGESCDDANLLGHDGCSSLCTGERPAWTDVTPAVPGRRMRAAMAYDPVRRRVVMVGGHRQEGGGGAFESPLPDLWENDGVQWVQRHPRDAPTGRVGASVAYDAQERAVVLFGGLDAHARNDLWGWDGARWQRLASSVSPASLPPARYRHGMAYDARNKLVVVFGGLDENSMPLGDTWTWNGTDWKQASPTESPSPREAAMAYDPVRGVIVMVGAPPTSSSYETWEFDGTTWQQKATGMAAPPAGGSPPTSLAFDAVSARILALGTSSTSSWDGTTWTSLGQQLPGVYNGASLAENPDGRVTLFGGQYDTCPVGTSCFTQDFANRDQTFEWTDTGWSEQLLDAPEPRSFACAALDTRRRVVVVVGGKIGATALQQTLEYDGFRWTKFAGAPWSSGRYFASIAYDEARDQMVVFGGADAETVPVVNAETWVRTGTGWANPTVVPSPPARVEAAMAYDRKQHQVVLFGGGDAAVNGVTFNDTWVWDGTTWTLMAPAHRPVDRRGAVLAWDARLERLVLFGGRHIADSSSEVRLADTWTWDGTDWIELTLPQSPSPRDHAAFAADVTRGTLVLFGGEDTSGRVADSWEWDGIQWRALSAVDSPSARVGHVMATAPDGAGLVTFGGEDLQAGTLSQTATLRWVGDGDYETCTLQIDADGDGLSGCGDPDCWARCTPTVSPRSLPDPAGPHCGDGTCSALEDCRMCPTDCVTCPDRCGDAVCDPAETAAACPGDCTP